MGNCYRSYTNDENVEGINMSVTTQSTGLHLPKARLSGSGVFFTEEEMSSYPRTSINIPTANEMVWVSDSSSDSEKSWTSPNSISLNQRVMFHGITSRSNSFRADLDSQNHFLALEFSSSSQSQSCNEWSIEQKDTEDPHAEWPYSEMKTSIRDGSNRHYEFSENHVHEPRSCFSIETKSFPPESELFVGHSTTTREYEATNSRDETTKTFIRSSLTKCNLFNGFNVDDLAVKVIDEIIDQMYPRDLKKGQILVHAGEACNAFWIVEFGGLEVLANTKTNPFIGGDERSRKANVIKPGRAVGEAALMWNTKQRATLCATEQTRVWVMEVNLFHRIRNLLTKVSKTRFATHQKFLSSLPIFAPLKPHEIYNLTQACREVTFRSGESIGNDAASDFYVVLGGTALIMRHRSNSLTLSGGEEISQGNFFMSKINRNNALYSVTASTDLKCLKIAANDYTLLVAPYMRLEYNERSDGSWSETDDESTSDLELPKDFKNRVPYSLHDFVPVAVAGTGSFGQVVLVKVKGGENEKKVYALKLLEKNQVINSGQIENVLNERRIMFMMDSPFIIKLYATYHDEMCVYFLLEKALGGELFWLLKRKTSFIESTARFYLGCIVLAFEHIHSHMIIYRDLKPENVLISSSGYVKVTDFGFAKRMNQSTSLCGTPAYMAPEMITGGIQSFAVDWWCAGILLFEMVVGEVPFKDSKHMKMYEKIMESPPNLPEKVSEECHELTHKLLEKNSFRRLGSGPLGTGDVKKKTWFQRTFPGDREQFGWEELSASKLTAPYVPTLTSSEDSRHFSSTQPKQEITKLCTKFDHSLYKWCEEF